MICHIMPDEKFTVRVVEFFDEQYKNQENYFIIYNENKRFYNGTSTNVYMCDSLLQENGKITDIMRKADKIIIHGFGAEQVVNYFNKHPFFLKKSAVMIWGGDLYNDFLYLEKHKGVCLRRRYFLWKKKVMIKKVRQFITFTYSDYDYAHEHMGVKGKRFDGLYPSNLPLKDLKKIGETIERKRDTARILVGNSATITNNHFEVFSVLKQFVNEDIEIFCPLSYGDMDYAREVEKTGISLFGNKFHAIKEYMSIEEYAKFLSSMDVAFFIFDRQQATANLEILGYFGVKVYLKQTCALWNHYVLRDNCSFFPFDEVANIGFKELIYFSDVDKKNNRNYFKKIWDDQYIKSLWDKVLYDKE